MSSSPSVPGQRTGIVTAPRDVLFSPQTVRYGRGIVDAASAWDGAHSSHEDELRPGTILAQITASKKWTPCKRTRVTPTGGATATALPVVDARAFKVGETITVGASAGITITAINYATNVLTIASTTFASSAVVFCDSLPGSEIARGILNEFIRLKDEDGVARDKTFGQLVIMGLVDPSIVLGDLASIKLATNYLGQIQYADEAGQA